jgi:hypothetical protein
VLKGSACEKIQGDQSIPLIELFDAMPWTACDTVIIAELREVIAYVRGSKHLAMPAEWRRVVPTVL